jgi:hypothetical protein
MQRLYFLKIGQLAPGRKLRIHRKCHQHLHPRFFLYPIHFLSFLTLSHAASLIFFTLAGFTYPFAWYHRTARSSADATGPG